MAFGGNDGHLHARFAADAVRWQEEAFPSTRAMPEPSNPQAMVQEATPPVAKPSLTARFQLLLKKYGWVALGIHFSLFFLAIGGFSLAIGLGLDVGGVSGTAGTLGAAYAAAQVIKPLRFMATLVLTPLVARLLGRSETDDTTPR